MKDKIMKITSEQHDIAVNAILDKGLKRRVSTWKYLIDMYNKLGLRIIFLDAIPGFLASLLFIITSSLAFITYFNNLTGVLSLYTAVFMLSPVMFIILTFSTEAIERFSGIYELKMTGKYTIRQISAFRILCFTLTGTVFTVIGSLIIATKLEQVYIINLLSLALSSIFLCSLLIIHTMRRWRDGWYIGTLIWVAICVLLMIFAGNGLNLFLSNLPPIITLSVSIIAFVMFLREIKITTKEIILYAYS
jgi:hypothetical protein